MTSRVFPIGILLPFAQGPTAAPLDIARPLRRAFLRLHRVFPATHALPRATANRFCPENSRGMTSSTPPRAEDPSRKALLRRHGSKRVADRLDSPAPLPGSRPLHLRACSDV